jgi:hypothetical protein
VKVGDLVAYVLDPDQIYLIVDGERMPDEKGDPIGYATIFRPGTGKMFRRMRYTILEANYRLVSEGG